MELLLLSYHRNPNKEKKLIILVHLSCHKSDNNRIFIVKTFININKTKTAELNKEDYYWFLVNQIIKNAKPLGTKTNSIDFTDLLHS